MTGEGTPYRVVSLEKDLKSHNIPDEVVKEGGAIMPVARSTPPEKMIVLTEDAQFETPSGMVQGRKGDVLINHDFNHETGTPGTEFEVVPRDIADHSFRPTSLEDQQALLRVRQEQSSAELQTLFNQGLDNHEIIAAQMSGTDGPTWHFTVLQENRLIDTPKGPVLGRAGDMLVNIDFNAQTGAGKLFEVVSRERFDQGFAVSEGTRNLLTRIRHEQANPGVPEVFRNATNARVHPGCCPPREAPMVFPSGL